MATTLVSTVDAAPETERTFAGHRHRDGQSDLRWARGRGIGNAAHKLLGYILRKVFRRCTSSMTFDQPSFERAMAELPPDALLVLAPTHRSYFDFLLVSYLCFEHPQLGIAMPHIAAADDFRSIPIIGRVLQAAQAFYIKRGGGPSPELGRDLRRLAEHNASLMFFVEGQRSRGRLMLPPKRGLLRALQATGRRFVMLPIAISYDRLPEEAAFHRELSGEPRPKMSLFGLVRWAFRVLLGRVHLGRVHMACGEPLLLSENTDIHALCRNLMFELQRTTVVSDFHLRAFLAETPLPGIDVAWLREAIIRRGGRVVESELPVPNPFPKELAHSLRNQWKHWFAGDALARQPGNLAVEDYFARHGWCSTGISEGDAERVDMVVRALFEPVATDYQTATYVGVPHQMSHKGVIYRPHFEDAVEALKALDIVRPKDGTHEWGPNAAALQSFRHACEWRAEQR